MVGVGGFFTIDRQLRCTETPRHSVPSYCRFPRLCRLKCVKSRGEQPLLTSAAPSRAKDGPGVLHRQEPHVPGLSGSGIPARRGAVPSGHSIRSRYRHKRGLVHRCHCSLLITQRFSSLKMDASRGSCLDSFVHNLAGVLAWLFVHSGMCTNSHTNVHTRFAFPI